MLKFKNYNEREDMVRICTVSMSSVQGGVQVELDVGDKSETILLTPMDAACFVQQTKSTSGLACMPVGHSITGSNADLRIYRILHGSGDTDWRCAGYVADVVIKAGSIMMAAPAFVVDAMRLAIERMMETLMYHSTGDMEEEFG